MHRPWIVSYVISHFGLHRGLVPPRFRFGFGKKSLVFVNKDILDDFTLMVEDSGGLI